jgi:hypothetical protein
MTKPYRVLVTGSRDWADDTAIGEALSEAIRPVWHDRDVVIVHGACPSGADQMAHEWAEVFGVTVEGHRAQDFGPWPACGPIRNQHMVSLGADVCLAFIGPCTSTRCRRPRPHPSHGASGCADLAERAGIPVRRWTA